MGTPNPTPIIDALVRGPLVDDKGNASPAFRRFLQETFAKQQNSLTLNSQFSSAAKIQGRSEGIGITVSKHDSTGKLTDADQIAADGASFVRVNPDQRTGGGRGFQALDSFNQLASSFHGTGVNLTNVPLSATTLSNDGVSTVIHVAAASDQFAPGVVTDNGGSVDPGAFGTFYVFHDDPRFTGGSVIYQSSTSQPDQAAAEGRILDGKITTALAVANTGGGTTGGTTGAGGRGGRNYA